MTTEELAAQVLRDVMSAEIHGDNMDPIIIAALTLARSEGRRERDEEWKKALALAHYDFIDGLHYECEGCAPLRVLLWGKDWRAANVLPTVAPTREE